MDQRRHVRILQPNPPAAADAALAQADKALQQAKQTSDKAVVAHNAAAEKLKQAQTARAAGQQAIDQANAALTAAQKAQQDAIREVQRLARVATVAWPAAGTVSPIGRLARTLAVSVQKETAPFQVVAEVPPRFEVNQSRQIVVPVKLLKRDGFDNAVTLTWVGQPKTVQIKNEPIAKGKAEGLYRIFVPNNAPVGTYTLYLRAQGQVSYRRNVELADAAKAEQAKADAAAKAADAALKSATPARVAADKKAADDANKAKAADAARKKAEQNAKNSAAALKKATDAQTAATKKVTDATNAAKDAEAKNKAAQEAAAKDANLKPQADAAAKTLADAQAALPKLQKEKQTADAAQVKAKQASDATATALANADKTLKDAQTASKTSTDAKTKAAAVVTAATASKKTVDAAKKAADQKLAAANKAAAAKNINIFPPSTPIVVQIKPGPATLAAAVPDGGKIKRGQKVDVKVTVKRLNGFAGPLTLTLPLPPGVAGLTAAPVTIPADKSEAVLSIQAAADATEGQLANLVIRATMEFQGKAAVDQAVALNVSK
ncbi:MAG: hypothetical protein CMJ48_04410 [Planctomycetaceae bacterium]|nr:hypothetical protein [Planctomycetaceae bacterium]